MSTNHLQEVSNIQNAHVIGIGIWFQGKRKLVCLSQYWD